MQFQSTNLLLGFTLFVGLFSSGVLSQTTGKSGASAATLQQLEIIENSIDHTVDPCDDFYSYACTKWEYQEWIEDLFSSNHVVVQLNFVEAVKKMLISKYPSVEYIKKQNQSIDDKVMVLYYSCRNNDDLEIFKEIKPAKDMEWPLLDEMNGKFEHNMENFNMFSFLGNLFSYGFNNFLLQFTVKRNSNGSLLVQLATAYKKDLDGIEFGYNRGENPEEFEKLQSEIHETHNEWLAIYKQYEKKNDELFTYHQVKNLYPMIAKFLDTILPNQLNDNDLVKIYQIDYIQFITGKQWKPQDIRRLCNYAMAFLQQYAYRVNSDSCIEEVMTKMHFAVNYMFRKSYYTAKVKETFLALKDKIYQKLIELVNENNLKFNTEQITAIKEKLANIYLNIGNVPDETDDAMVKEFYRNLPDFDINNHSKNLLLTLRQRLWEGYNCPPNMECLIKIGHGTYNLARDNLVIIALASMTPPIYDPSFDPLFALSLMGIIIGHEYGHSIDERSLRDEKIYKSNYEEFKNHANFNASIECTTEQFSTGYLRQLQVDLIGARAAYRAYTTEYNIQPSYSAIPWQKLFFLNFAQFFCQIKHWDDTPGSHIIRTNHVAMNMKEFAEAFKCPVGSKMNPEKKCLYF